MANPTSSNQTRFYAGTDFDPKATPSEIMGQIAKTNDNLGYQLTYTPLYAGELRKIAVPNHRCLEAVDNQGNRSIIDVYGRDRVMYQNTDMVDFFQRIANHYEGLELKTIGFSGFDIYASVTMPVIINPKNVGDITEVSLVIYEPRHADQGMTFNTYYNRLVCTNGMRDRVKVGNIVVDHRKGINMNKVDYLINTAIAQSRTKETILEVLANTPMSIDEAHLLLIQEFGDPTKTLDDQPKLVQTCLSLFSGQADGAEMVTAYQTAYGLLQSLTQNYRGVRDSQESFLRILNNTQVSDRISSFERQLLTVSSNRY